MLVHLTGKYCKLDEQELAAAAGIGTLAFRAPELQSNAIVRMDFNQARKSDIYAFGAVAWCLALSQPEPFDAERDFEMKTGDDKFINGVISEGKLQQKVGNEIRRVVSHLARGNGNLPHLEFLKTVIPQSHTRTLS